MLNLDNWIKELICRFIFHFHGLVVKQIYLSDEHLNLKKLSEDPSEDPSEDMSDDPSENQ
jgi:hypothetical protein